MQERFAFILPLADVSARLSQVGGKGASLAWLTAAGLPVPPGFHVTTAAYRRFVTEHGLQEQILSTVSAVAADQQTQLKEASKQIAGLFAQNVMPDEIAEAIGLAYAGLGGGDLPVAMRSRLPLKTCPSCRLPVSRRPISTSMASDGARCRQALLGVALDGAGHRLPCPPPHRAYRCELGSCRAAGIMFTANPVTRTRDQVLISAI